MITEHKTLHSHQTVITEVCTDGGSAPFLELIIKCIRTHEYVYLSKEQLEELISDLQRKLTEL